MRFPTKTLLKIFDSRGSCREAPAPLPKVLVWCGGPGGGLGGGGSGGIGRRGGRPGHVYAGVQCWRMQSLLLLLLLHFSCCLVLLLLLLLLLLVPPLDHLRNWIFQSDSHRYMHIWGGKSTPRVFLPEFSLPFFAGDYRHLAFSLCCIRGCLCSSLCNYYHVRGNRRYLQIDYLLLFSLFLAAVLPQQPIVYASPKNRGGTMHTRHKLPGKKMPQKLELLLTRTSKEEGKK